MLTLATPIELLREDAEVLPYGGFDSFYAPTISAEATLASLLLELGRKMLLSNRGENEALSMRHEFTCSKTPKEAVDALRTVQDVLGGSIVGAYLFGSAVAGGLRPSSDVDVMVVVNDGLTDDKRKMLVSALMKVSGRVGDAAIRPLELTIVQLSEVVPWRYPPRMEFCYGEWLREAFEKGQIPSPSPNPDLAIILTQVRNEGVTLLGSDASALFDPVPMADLHRAMRECLPHLLEWLWGDERNVLLTLARMWLTASVGEIAPKDAAAEWAIERLPKEQALLLDVARRAYLGECLDDWKGQESRVMALATSMETSIKACLIE